jgi:HSP20 family protein
MTLVKFRNGSLSSGLPTLEKAFEFPSFVQDVFENFLAEDENLNWMPSVNIREGADNFRIDLAVPGMSKEDFTVDLENNLLSISGERKEEQNESSEKVTRREFHYGSFRRKFTLPVSADSEKIHASYKDGILSLIIEKRDEARQKPKKQISIE